MPSEQQAFQRLLDLEDTDLLRYLMGEDTPQDIELASLVQVLRVTGYDVRQESG